MVGDGVGSTTGAGDSDGIACSSASAIASSPPRRVQRRRVVRSLHVRVGRAQLMPGELRRRDAEPEQSRALRQHLVQLPEPGQQHLSLAGVIPNPRRQPIDDPNGT